MAKEQMKAKAVEFMKKLDIYEPYIDGFAKKDMVCFYEGFGGFWVFQEPEIEKKMREIEKKYDCTVYAITHEFTDFGECYSFLIVTDYEEEWEDLLSPWGENQFAAYAYVWNKDCKYCSEFGSIGIQSCFGGIRRCA